MNSFLMRENKEGHGEELGINSTMKDKDTSYITMSLAEQRLPTYPTLSEKKK